MYFRENAKVYLCSFWEIVKPAKVSLKMISLDIRSMDSEREFFRPTLHSVSNVQFSSFFVYLFFVLKREKVRSWQALTIKNPTKKT